VLTIKSADLHTLRISYKIIYSTKTYIVWVRIIAESLKWKTKKIWTCINEKIEIIKLIIFNINNVVTTLTITATEKKKFNDLRYDGTRKPRDSIATIFID